MTEEPDKAEQSTSAIRDAAITGEDPVAERSERYSDARTLPSDDVSTDVETSAADQEPDMLGSDLPAEDERS